MSITTEVYVTQRLATLQPNIIAQVADDLAVQLPMVGLDPNDPQSGFQHYQRMRATAERFHELVQLGSSMDWNLVAFEYGWTMRVLRPMGITWDHQLILIDSYFTAARVVAAWDSEELAVLDGFAERLRTEGERAYHE